jgi:anaerobic selenocysteine-containing dehydrogenase
MTKRIITTCTRDCPNACGLIATVSAGKVTDLRGNPAHSLTKGFACRKCADFVRRGESSDRVLTPLRRTRGGGWSRVSWKEALDEVAGRMAELRETDGPEAILAYRGFAQRTALKLLNDRFFNLFGGVTGTYGTLCGGTGEAAQTLDFGRRVSHDPSDHDNAASMIVWGRNPAATNPYLLPVISRIRRRGGTVVLIDPVASETRKAVDRHIQPAPGTDGFLALAAAKLLLEWRAAEYDFIAKHAEGFEPYREILDRYSLDELSRRCDVTIPEIEGVARLLAEERPTAILLGWGIHRWEYAHQTVRAIDALGAVAGIIGIPGGGVSQGFDEYAPFDLYWTGDSLHPGRRRLLMPCIGEEILSAREPEIGMIFVTAGNPACMAPNSKKVRAGFEKTGFVVVAGHFLDDTAAAADIFLPVTTFLEEEDVVASYGHNWIGPVNRAVEPPGECRSDFDLFADLASRFDFGDDFGRSREEWLELLLAPTLAQGVTLSEVREGPVRLPGAPLVPYAGGRFPTESGKFRFLDDFVQPPERPEDAGFPYRLLSVSPPQWLCSESTPREQGEPTEIRLHPDEAARAGIIDGETVSVESEVGATLGRLRLSEEERRDTLVFPRGKWISSGSSANLLTRDVVSRVGNGAAYYETRVRIRRVVEP